MSNQEKKCNCSYLKGHRWHSDTCPMYEPSTPTTCPHGAPDKECPVVTCANHAPNPVIQEKTCKCSDISNGDIIEMDKNHKCVVCGRDWSLDNPSSFIADNGDMERIKNIPLGEILKAEFDKGYRTALQEVEKEIIELLRKYMVKGSLYGLEKGEAIVFGSLKEFTQKFDIEKIEKEMKDDVLSIINNLTQK